MEVMLPTLNSISPLSPGLREHLSSIVRIRTFKTREIIHREGTIANSIYFIEKGLVRSFYYKNNREISSWFMKERDFFVSVQSFFLQKPSYETIEALEDTVLWGISYSQLQETFERFPEFNLHRALILEKYYCMSEERHHLTLMTSAVKKYAELLKNDTWLASRVKVRYLCTYLGINKSSLCRIRAMYGGPHRRRR